MPSILAVAEKPSVARELAAIIGQNQAQTRNGQSPYNKIFDIPNCEFMGTRARMALTSVLGHMTNLAFGEEHAWKNGCAPEALFDAPVHSIIKEEHQALKRTLIDEAKKHDILFLWLDCDLEGEAIGKTVEHDLIPLRTIMLFANFKQALKLWRYVSRPIQGWMSSEHVFLR